MAKTDRSMSMADLAFAIQKRAPELDAELGCEHSHFVLRWGDRDGLHGTATVDREMPSRYEIVVYESPFWRPLALRSALTLDAAVSLAAMSMKAGGAGVPQ